MGCEFNSAPGPAASQLDDSDKVITLCDCFSIYKKITLIAFLSILRSTGGKKSCLNGTPL